MTGGQRGVGVDGHLGPRAIADLAVLAEQCGYGSYWININERDQDVVSAFAQSAARTKSIEIGIGVDIGAEPAAEADQLHHADEQHQEDRRDEHDILRCAKKTKHAPSPDSARF